MSSPQTLVTFGKFDGVHLGHQTVLTQCVEWAESKGLASVALILDTNLTPSFPAPLDNPINAPSGNDQKTLTTLYERQRLIKALGIDFIVTQKLNSRFKALTSDQFLGEILQDRLGASMVVFGPGQQFGSDGASFRTFSDTPPASGPDTKGGISPLVTVRPQRRPFVSHNNGTSEEHSLPRVLEMAEICQLASVDGKNVSSQAIRQAIGQQNFGLAHRMLGRRYSLRGLVVPGSRRGGQIGFPTANLSHIETLIPPPGVYHCLTKVLHNSFPAAVSIGHNQTFGANLPMSVEVHIILDAPRPEPVPSSIKNLDLYGKYLTIEFIRLLRPMRKFDSVNALIAQIRNDIGQILNSTAAALN
jgi:riboflavin kinase/FMN adenylyltransferase